VRYSFINHDGTETDISDIVESEWRAAGGQQQQRPGLGVQQNSSRPGSRASSKYTVGAASATDADSFQTAPQTPRDENRQLDLGSDADEDEQEAINAVNASRVDIDLSGTGPYKRVKSAASSTSLRQNPSSATTSLPGPDGGDILQDALGPRPVTSPVFNESLQERLDRVLAKVKEDKIRRAASPSGSAASRPRSYIAGSATPSGRASPAVLSGRLSPLNTTQTGRLSPLGGRDSPTIDQLISQSPRSQSNQSRQSQHGKKPSVASVSSILSSGTDQLSTPVTGNSSNGRAPSGASFTPASSATSNHRRPVVYPAEFGFDTLVTIVNAAEDSPRPSSSSSTRDVAREALFGRDLNDLNLSPPVQQLYEPRFKTLNELETVSQPFSPSRY